MRLSLSLFLCAALLIVAAATVACSEPHAVGDLTGIFMDVGKADAILLYTADTTVLIDTGYRENYATVRDTLKREGRARIDYLILTHYDKDHIGGAPAVLSAFEVGEILLPAFDGAGEAYDALTQSLAATSARVTRLTEPRMIPIASAAMLRVSPTALARVEGENDTSLITEVRWGGFGLLLLGDALKARVEEYTATVSETYQVVKTPHHGDYFKALKTCLQRVGAEHAIACVDGTEREVEEKYHAMCEELGLTAWHTDGGEIRLTYDATAGKYRIEQS